MSHALQRPLPGGGIPTETWQRIFDFLPLKTLLLVRATSIYLPNIASVHPQFCTNIEFSPRTGRLEFLEMRVNAGVTAGGHRPLDLKLDLLDFSSERGDNDDDNLTAVSTKVLTTVTPFLCFIRTLDVTVLEADYYVVLLPLLQQPAPALRSLRIEVADVDHNFPGPTLPHDLFQGHASQLEHITLVNMTVPNRPSTALASVKTLCWLGGDGASYYYDLPDAYEMLLPSVSKLELGGESLTDVPLNEAFSGSTLSAISRLQSLRLSALLVGKNAELYSSLSTCDIPTIIITAEVGDDVNAQSFLSLVSRIPPGDLSLMLSASLSHPGHINLSVNSVGERHSTCVLEVPMPCAEDMDEQVQAFIWLFSKLEDINLASRVTELGADTDFGPSIISECLLRLPKASVLTLTVHCEGADACGWLGACDSWFESEQDVLAGATADKAIQPDVRLVALRHVRLNAPHGHATLKEKATMTTARLIQRMPQGPETYGADISTLSIPWDAAEALRVAALPQA